MERRRYPRMQINQFALLYHPQGFPCPCRIENISSAGLFIKTSDSRIAKGACVNVVFNFYPHNHKPITTKGLVVHKDDHGIGLLCNNYLPAHDFSPAVPKCNGVRS